MAYPAWLRKKVLEYKAAHGLSLRAVAEHFKIHFNTIARWKDKPEPAKTRNKSPLKIHDATLIEDVAQFPDDFQYERAARLGVSSSGICWAMKRLNLTRKKNRRSP